MASVCADNTASSGNGAVAASIGFSFFALSSFTLSSFDESRRRDTTGDAPPGGIGAIWPGATDARLLSLTGTAARDVGLSLAVDTSLLALLDERRAEPVRRGMAGDSCGECDAAAAMLLPICLPKLRGSVADADNSGVEVCCGWVRWRAARKPAGGDSDKGAAGAVGPPLGGGGALGPPAGGGGGPLVFGGGGTNGAMPMFGLLG
mmetsp:Transcript_17785/g.31107  ORF Transcript_17785/g.31107 Transcript_17785/m.31107 type:complete len:205 (-) Transcript_17785:144-758(-)